MGSLAEVWTTSRKNRRKDRAKYMEGAGDDCSKEDILSSRDQSQEVRANRRNVAHADDAGDP